MLPNFVKTSYKALKLTEKWLRTEKKIQKKIIICTSAIIVHIHHRGIISTTKSAV